MLDITHIRKALVIAPHPDDESLGCGGLLAILAERNCEVTVVFVTDGGASHRNSTSWSRMRLAAQRQKEADAALSELGLGRAGRLFFNLRDADMPTPSSNEWYRAVTRLSSVLKTFKPDLALIPWRRDPHCDHRASHALAMQAMRLHPPTTILEYAIWLDELGNDEDRPSPREATRLELDIRSCLEAKKRAIAMHVTQTTRLISDDPFGFLLSAETIARLTGPEEYYWQSTDAVH
jgi:LmbE family N-acetylglucosaminyl deacetylase